jgi:hypothetical protein
LRDLFFMFLEGLSAIRKRAMYFREGRFAANQDMYFEFGGAGWPHYLPAWILARSSQWPCFCSRTNVSSLTVKLLVPW